VAAPTPRLRLLSADPIHFRSLPMNRRRTSLLLALASAVACSIVCAAPAVPAPEQGGPLFQRAPDDPGTTSGYTGPYYNPAAVTGEVVVLEESVQLAPGRSWRVTGLVRNQTGRTVRLASLTATALGALGQVLGEAEAWLPVTELRPGEPAPFKIDSSLVAGTVAAIRWTLRLDPRAQATARRGARFELFWVRPHGDDDPRQGYPIDDAATPPYPYVLFGAVRNVGLVDLEHLRVVGAWLDAAGRVHHVAALALHADDFTTARPTATLRPAGIAHVSYVDAATRAGPALDALTFAAWSIAP
jgi:hypothetical protein